MKKAWNSILKSCHLTRFKSNREQNGHPFLERTSETDEVVAENGCHSKPSIATLQNETKITPASERKTNRYWTDKTVQTEGSYRRNRRNTQGDRGRKRQRLRSERVNKICAHLGDTSGKRQTWLGEFSKVQKRYTIAHNQPRIMRQLIQTRKPRYAPVVVESLVLSTSPFERSKTPRRRF